MDLDKFCWCCLKTDANLLDGGETFQNDGVEVKVANWWLNCSGPEPTATTIPIQSCRICTLCLVSLKISYSFSAMCRQSRQKLEELCKVRQLAENNDDVQIVENGENSVAVDRDAQLKKVRQKLLLEEQQQQEMLSMAHFDAGTMPIEPLNMLELLYDTDADVGGIEAEPDDSSPMPELKIADVQSLAVESVNSGRVSPPLKRRLYRCQICWKSFNFQSVLERHKCKSSMQLNRPGNAADSGRHFCTRCPKSFSFPSLLVRHERQHEKHKCDQCGAGFTRSSTLATHKILEHAEIQTPVAGTSTPPAVVVPAAKKEYGCNLCGKSFSFLSVLQKHIAQHGKYKCDLCGLGFTRSTWLESHLKDVHQIVKSDISVQNELEPKKMHRCHLCDKVFLFHSVLLRHIAMHSKYKCESCDQGFGRRGQLEAHVAEEHNGDGNESTSSGSARNREHPCTLCGKVFMFRSRLLNHMANHEKYRCSMPQCAAGFTRLKDLEDHMFDVHQIERQNLALDEFNVANDGHVCPLCGKKFDYQSVLIRHMTQHDKHKCVHCDMGFTRSNLLDRHVAEVHPEFGGATNVTTSDTGFGHGCHLCDKVFPFPSALKVHLAAHKYKCNYCDKIFTRQSNVDMHVRDEHPDMFVEVAAKVENRCEICQKVFDFPSALKLHLAWHNKHKCQHCDASYPRMNLLEGHIKDTHPDVWEAASVRVNAAKPSNRCHLCNKMLPFPSALKLHLAWHAKHKCPHTPCDKAFPTLLLVDDHIRIDHPDKWEERRPETKVEHRCDLCDKVFPFPSALKLHLAWHTKYKCEDCDQPFPTRLLLNGHICRHSKDTAMVEGETSGSFAIKTEAQDYNEDDGMLVGMEGVEN